MSKNFRFYSLYLLFYLGWKTVMLHKVAWPPSQNRRRVGRRPRQKERERERELESDTELSLAEASDANDR
jgi:hypothetical protein